MTKELILQAREKANAGLRLNLQEALALYEDNDLLFSLPISKSKIFFRLGANCS